MMNKKIIVIIFIVVLICLTAVFVITRNNNDGSTQNPSEHTSKSVTIRTKEIKNTNSSSINVDIKMPQFENLSPNFNSFINSKIDSELGFDPVYNEVTAGLSAGDIGAFSYEATYNREDFYNYISLVAYQNIELVPDRAITRKRCYNVDVVNNRSAVLKDVFLNKTNYKKKIMEEVNMQAERKGIELKGDGFDYMSDTQAFYIKNGKLIIYFEAGEIAPVSYGELDFEMPFTVNEGLFIY